MRKKRLAQEFVRILYAKKYRGLDANSIPDSPQSAVFEKMSNASAAAISREIRARLQHFAQESGSRKSRLKRSTIKIEKFEFHRF